MEPGFLFVLFAIVAIGVVAFSVVSTAKRRESAAAVAGRLGMTYHQRDDLGITRLPHPIFRMGDSRKATNLVTGTLRDRQVTLFDYEYVVHQTDAEGKRSSTTHRFSAVMVELGIACPPTTIRRERITTKLANALGFGRDVQFESDEFNRAFEVRTQSQQFAFTLIDPAMMQWLMANGFDLDMQFHSGVLAVIASRRPWTEMEGLATRVLDFTDQFPRLVWSSYGKSES